MDLKHNIQVEVLDTLLRRRCDPSCALHRAERRKRKGKEQPMSLWEELSDIGEEFVEFLEKEIGLGPPEVCCSSLNDVCQCPHPLMPKAS